MTLFDDFETNYKQFNRKNGLIRCDYFLNYMFCIKIIHFDTLHTRNFDS